MCGVCVEGLRVCKRMGRYVWCGCEGASIWSSCSVRIGLWPRLPRGCYRVLSFMPMFGAPAEC